MKDLRTKIAIAAVIFGLGGLGGFAMSSNPAGQQPITVAPAAVHTQGGSPVTTGASGATSSPTSSPLINAPATQPLPRTTGLAKGGQDD